MSKFWESGPIIKSLQVSKNYFRFMDINVVINAIYGGQFGQNRSFLGPKLRHMSKFGESGEIILSLNVSKNYFSRVYGTDMW